MLAPTVTMPLDKKENTIKPPKKITEKYLQNSGLYYLQRFPASRAHFQSVMLKKIQKSIKHHETPSLDEAKAFLDKVTIYFEDLGFLNDPLYAKGLTGSLFRKGMSGKMISYRLRQKGLEQDLIKECLQEVLPNNSDMIAAVRLLKRRRYGVFATSADKQDLKKSLAVLARAGFAYDVANRALALSLEESNNILQSL